MSVTIKELIEEIEELRKNLVNTKVGRSYSDPNVVTASQKLDGVLNKYQELVKLKERDY